MRINKILLVGGSGYIGSHLKDAVEGLFDVYTTSRKSSNEKNSYQLDLKDESTYGSLNNKTFDLIIILASEIKGIGNLNLTSDILMTNVIGLVDFLNFIEQSKISRKVIYVSSMTVYGKDNLSPVKEEGALAPLSSYGFSKQMAENSFKFFSENSEIKGVTFRIPGIYGGSRKAGFIYNTAVKMKNSQKVVLNTKGLGYWECMYMADLCFAIIEFMKTYDWSKKYDVYNISYGSKTDFIDCAFKIKEFMNSSSFIEIEGEKEYVDLFMDNSKINKIINIADNYLISLKKYVKELV